VPHTDRPRVRCERPAGVEPAPPNWQAGVQPGTPWARDHESRGRDSNPRVHRVATGGLTILATSTGERTTPGVGSPPTSPIPDRHPLSERQDSNLRRPAPKAGGQPLPHAQILGDRPVSIRHRRVHSAACRATTPRPPWSGRGGGTCILVARLACAPGSATAASGSRNRRSSTRAPRVCAPMVSSSGIEPASPALQAGAITRSATRTLLWPGWCPATGIVNYSVVRKHVRCATKSSGDEESNLDEQGQNLSACR
jgi:hypothetical protein